ncbi:MAG: ABC transporter permease, partial [Microbacteriaceae bacterium]
MTETIAPQRSALPRIMRTLGFKLLGAVFVLWGAATLAFLSMQMIPGDPVDVMLGPLSTVTPEAREALRESMGLNLPIWQQYIEHLGRMAMGDFGVSFQHRKEVLTVLAGQAMPTLFLALAAMAIALLMAIGFAFLTRKGFLRFVANIVELFA